MSSELWLKKMYSSPINYITSSFIREYDISKADASVFLTNGIISQEQFDFLARVPSLARNIQLGILQQEHPEYKAILKNGIESARRMFFEANNIQDWEVLSIKNDAVFLINKVATTTSFGNIVFKNKRTYTSFYALPRKFNKEFFYYLDRVNGIETLDIKGMNSGALELHKNYFTEFLLVLFNSIELFPISDSIDLLQTFYNRYINKELDVQYYRRYDQISGFDTCLESPILKHRYNLQHISEKDIDIVDIRYNADIIVEFYKMISGMYFNKKK